ncbi:autotransporter domain-containing protein [Microvirga sp. W0021]|uniref:Autotransporter domain-containing protein n=1 Tax=Hohaiivirga grylli TaxID=3133970 RepID=A0ABV0BMC0_9HYPH
MKIKTILLSSIAILLSTGSITASAQGLSSKNLEPDFTYIQIPATDATTTPTWLSGNGAVLVGEMSQLTGAIEAFRWTLSSGTVGLGHIDPNPSFAPYSSATYTSKDGSVVIGNSTSANAEREAFRWTETGGMQGLGFLNSQNPYSLAYWTSDNGNVIAGQSINDQSMYEAFRWTETTGMVGLGFITGSGITPQFSSVISGSSDGSVLVGTGHYFDSNNNFVTEAFRWTEAGGMQGLGHLSNSIQRSQAIKTNPDGSVVIGVSNDDNGQIVAFRWNENLGMHGLGTIDENTIVTQPMDLSGDGNTIIGVALSSAGRQEAFRWTEETGMKGLGFIDPNASTLLSIPYRISLDGTVIVGAGTTTESLVYGQTEAFRWTEKTGMQSIRGILAENGVTIVDTNFLVIANLLSDDGQIMAGYGFDPTTGVFSSWIARIPNESIDTTDPTPPVGPTEPGVTPPTVLPPQPPSVGFITDQEVGVSVQDTAAKVLQVQNLPSAALSDLRFAATKQCAPWENKDTRFCAFITGSGAFWSSNGDYGKGNLISGSAGISMNLLPGFSIGTAFTAGAGDYDLRLGGKNKISSYGVSLFATYAPSREGLQLLGAVTTSWHDIDISRSYMNGSRASVLSKDSTDGQSWGALGRVGWSFAMLDKTWLTPYAEIEWTRSKVGGYQEEGGPFPIAFKNQTARELISRLGLEVRHQFSDSFEMFARAAWAHRLSGHADILKGIMIDTYDVSSGNIRLSKKDWAELAVGASWNVTPDTRVSGSVSTIIGKSNQPDATVRIGSSTRF